MSRQYLTRPFLSDLYGWWFKGLPQVYHQQAPEEMYQRWFKSKTETDNYCREKYGAAVKEAGELTVDQIREITTTPEEAVASVILLDQIPRNIFRKDLAYKAYREYDPKALRLTKIYLGKPYQYGRRSLHTNFLGSYFFYLPLMHSENITDHELLSSLLSARKKECESDAERETVQRMIDFETMHRDVLDRYGRYPSRNTALGRKSTTEEVEYLRNGGGFGA